MTGLLSAGNSALVLALHRDLNTGPGSQFSPHQGNVKATTPQGEVLQLATKHRLCTGKATTKCLLSGLIHSFRCSTRFLPRLARSSRSPPKPWSPHPGRFLTSSVASSHLLSSRITGCDCPHFDDLRSFSIVSPQRRHWRSEPARCVHQTRTFLRGPLRCRIGPSDLRSIGSTLTSLTM